MEKIYETWIKLKNNRQYFCRHFASLFMYAFIIFSCPFFLFSTSLFIQQNFHYILIYLFFCLKTQFLGPGRFAWSIQTPRSDSSAMWDRRLIKGATTSSIFGCAAVQALGEIVELATRSSRTARDVIYIRFPSLQWLWRNRLRTYFTGSKTECWMLWWTNRRNPFVLQSLLWSARCLSMKATRGMDG